jgi:hypothetical protein
MPLTDGQRQEALAEIYRQARHTVDSDGGNLHTMRALLGPELYRGLVAAELLRRVTQVRVRDDAMFRARVTGLYALLTADPDLVTIQYPDGDARQLRAAAGILRRLDPVVPQPAGQMADQLDTLAWSLA